MQNVEFPFDCIILFLKKPETGYKTYDFWIIQ